MGRGEPGPPRPHRPRWLRWLGRAALLAIAVAIAAGAFHEVRTSALQARLLPPYAERLSFAVAAGPSERIAFPDRGGPFDVRRGYARIPEFQARLQERAYRVERQAVVSPEMEELFAWGISPPYREAPVAGLLIRGAGGQILYDGADRDLVFETYEDVPSVLADTLLYLENRELPSPRDPRSNPVIEWDRQAWATLLYAGSKIGLPVSVEGGSTLGTQMEKYRHSPEGRTNSAADKLRQLAAATLKAYRNGADTRAWRNAIVVDYLNSIPLSAPPGYGEVYGIGEGLYAWFGLRLDSVRGALAGADDSRAKVQAYKHVLALLAALPAPSTYLLRARASLEQRANDLARRLADAGVIAPAFAAAVEREPLLFLPRAPLPEPRPPVQRKGLNAVRTSLLRALGVADFYALDRLHLEVDSSLDAGLQEHATDLLVRLTEPEFVAAKGLVRKRMLRGADPTKVVYSLMLFERTPGGNVLRVHADNLDQPFDVNDGVMMELGSTAKLRTLAHYLEVMAELHAEHAAAAEPRELRRRAADAGDPLSRWAMETLGKRPDLDLDAFLALAMDRKYSASPWETFFTGGGQHTFANFDKSFNRRRITLREGMRHSVNLVFIRLMRDLVRYHTARLAYDAAAVRADRSHPLRRQMLEEIGEEEARTILGRAHRRFRGKAPEEVVRRLLGSRAGSARSLAVLYYAWDVGAAGTSLAEWLGRWRPSVTDEKAEKLARSFDNPRWDLLDHAYLLDRHPLQVAAAGVHFAAPDASWEEVLARTEDARRLASSWLLRTKSRRAQDTRLRIRIERDAFERMTPSWQRLGFPFRRLVPSYATAIGNSSDRPAALADLMGIIVNDGVRLPLLRLTRLHFAPGTPYETDFAPAPDAGERVMNPAVARALRAALADVVERGTAGRLAGVFVAADGSAVVAGGKTGSGDNRFKTFTRWGAVTSSRAVSRTATFVFYVGDRYFGVLTAFVPGEDADAYEFTSSLPVAVLQLLAPAINERL